MRRSLRSGSWNNQAQYFEKEYADLEDPEGGGYTSICIKQLHPEALALLRDEGTRQTWGRQVSVRVRGGR